ncbi:MAG: GDP-mannose 4,6-dehydratase [Promethearchaeota archaeon]
MQKVFITGANGFIGSHLTDFFIYKGYEVFSLVRHGSNLKNLERYTNGESTFSSEMKKNIFNENIQIPVNFANLTLLECDLKNDELLHKILSHIRPNFIFHFGAQSNVVPSWEDPIGTIETNVIGTINLFEAIKKIKFKTKVIMACTAAEYGTTTEIKRPLIEIDPLMAIHPYGISKIAAELLARQYYLNFGIDIVNLRFFIQVGPRKVGDACADFVSKVAQIELGLAEPVIEVGNLNPYRDFTGINDTIQAIWLAAEKGKSGEVYNVCSNKKTQIKELLNMAIKLSSRKIKVVENVPNRMRNADEDTIIGDNSKIRKELGFNINSSLEETIKETFDYWIEYYKKSEIKN